VDADRVAIDNFYLPGWDRCAAGECRAAQQGDLRRRSGRREKRERTRDHEREPDNGAGVALDAREPIER
jgi:hypothetical protein